jgi:hypothetical protein
MKKILVAALVAGFALTALPAALADNDPFPSTKQADVFVSGQTVTPDGAIANFFAPGTRVIFRAYAVDPKTGKAFTKPADIRYFYVQLPNQSTVKMKYDPKAAGANGIYAWTGTWLVPANYPTGSVAFKLWVRTNSNRYGLFVQMPVVSSILTITTTPQNPFGGGPSAPTANEPAALVINADTVNGTRPSGVAPRPVGCTQSNVFKRGEQLVVRAWGYENATGTLLSNENVTDAHFTLTGVPDVKLNWGTHGAAPNRVFFWANAVIIPATYPLGDVAVKITYTTTSGKKGTLDYPVTITP